MKSIKKIIRYVFALYGLQRTLIKIAGRKRERAVEISELTAGEDDRKSGRRHNSARGVRAVKEGVCAAETTAGENDVRTSERDLTSARKTATV